ncbi:MAG: Tfp pilus assembly protein FimT/FimU [Thermodesulfovibrionales bacterium]
MRNNRGVTLVELLVVISIIAILAVALGFTYQGWQGSFKVENAVKQLHADLMTARTLAMSTKVAYIVDFPTATSYEIRTWNDTNSDGKIDAAEITGLPAFPVPKTLQYPVPAGIVGVLYIFDQQGLISSGNLGNPPVLIDPENPPVIINPPVKIFLTSTNTPDYDCITMSQSRINIGLMAAGVCNAK